MAKNKNPWEDDGPVDNKQNENIKSFSDFVNSHKQNSNNNFDVKIKWIVLAGLVLWLVSGFYQVEPNEQGVILQFGKYKETTESGLRYRIPYPIETITKVDMTQERSFTLGVGKQSTYEKFTESHMLTGDENIVDINLTVVWRVKDAANYLFRVREADQTVEVAAQSVLREIVGQSNMEDIITGDRGKIEVDTMLELQNLLNSFESGIEIIRVRLQKADPPSQVVDAFNEVQRARADMVKFQNEAEAYKNEVVPRAYGQASEVINAAEAYRAGIINKAEGEVQRFESVLSAYKQGREVTSKKLYIDAMEEVITNSTTTIVDPSTKGNGVLPILPLKTK